MTVITDTSVSPNVSSSAITVTDPDAVTFDEAARQFGLEAKGLWYSSPFGGEVSQVVVVAEDTIPTIVSMLDDENPPIVHRSVDGEFLALDVGDGFVLHPGWAVLPTRTRSKIAVVIWQSARIDRRFTRKAPPSWDDVFAVDPEQLEATPLDHVKRNVLAALGIDSTDEPSAPLTVTLADGTKVTVTIDVDEPAPPSVPTFGHP